MRSTRLLSGGAAVKKVNVQIDHVHMVIIIPPRLPVTNVVQFMKSRTAAALKEKFGFMTQAIYGRPGIWSRGF